MFKNIGFAPPMDDVDSVPMFSISDDDNTAQDDIYSDQLPIIALRNTVLFPGVVIPINIGRQKSVQALRVAQKKDKFVGVLAQMDGEIEDPGPEQLYKVGTVARIIKVLTMPDGSTTAILQGRKKFSVAGIILEEPYIEAQIQVLEEEYPMGDIELDATISSIRDIAKRIIELSPSIPMEANMMIQNIKSNVFLLYFIISNLAADTLKKQKILELPDIKEKSAQILSMMDNELQMMELKNQIQSKVRGDIEKQQKEYFLNQQLKTIQEELGQNPQEEELNELEKKAKQKNWNENIAKTFEKELNKARRTNPQIAEYSVILNYLETLLDLPWGDFTEDQFDLKKVEEILNEDHYGLEDVKDRIMEHLAVLKLKGDMKAPILCLVGPPGVGKTSLGKSVARALNRNFARMSLGGLHDESEIRGHRKTYIGAMPGRIIQSLKKCGSSNPVFVLDEIDKLGTDFRGDPSSALLEVLDPEQNSAFYDNYLELEYDLSKVLFIATANSLSTIQPPLLDRMEIIDIAGYSQEEKIEIAKNHLIPKQLIEHGLKEEHVIISRECLQHIIKHYTRESGVRSLDRRIAGVMRHIAKKVAMGENYEVSVKTDYLEEILGPRKINPENYTKIEMPGVAVGLAWTRTGGDILFIEVSTSKGKGKLTLTGNLGDVMKESATTALSYIKSNSETLGIDQEIFDQSDIHIHVPEGAIPKDGPSAGITMLSALVSAFKKKPIKPYVAMTGEITLRGKVLPVGGIKEKVLAAKRSGIEEIILCKENEKDVKRIKESYIEGLTFHFVKTMDEVIHLVLGFTQF
ncbi:MAG TPA: endopeptidase La [Saprospiraceae bacterium]|nr:endopeptidase La [Saprospiraceae bacterium]